MGDTIGIPGESRTLSVTCETSGANAEFVPVSLNVVVVRQRRSPGTPVTRAAVHPAGSVGAVTRSKFSLSPFWAHWSPTVQTLPSSHGFVLFVNTQRPVAGLQASLVQTLPSSQTTGFAPTHDPFWQLSGDVQALLSLHTVLLGATGFEQRPVTVLQVPAMWHWSNAVQVTFVGFSQRPVLALQIFAVQALASSHGGGGPPWQTVPTQMSPVVQALPSLHVLGSMTVVVDVAVLLAVLGSPVLLEAVAVLVRIVPFPMH